MNLSTASHILKKVEDGLQKRKLENVESFSEFLHSTHPDDIDFDIKYFMDGYPLTYESQKLELVKPGSWGIFQFVDVESKHHDLGGSRLNEIWTQSIQEEVLECSESKIDELFEKLPYQDVKPYKIDLLDRQYHGKPFINLNEFDTPLRYLYDVKKKTNFPWAGILIPMYLISSNGTLSSLHFEDHSMASINVMNYAAPGAKAPWIIINRKHNDKLISILEKETGIECDCLLRSKKYVFSPARLSADKIDFETIIQEPRDAVIMGAEVLHCILNFGYTIKSASNFIPTDKAMLKIMTEMQYCECSDGRVEDGLVTKHKHGQDLRRLFININTAVEGYHRDRHNKLLESVMQAEKLTDFEKNKKKTCPKCNKMVNASNISSHLKIHEPKLNIPCKSCGKLIARENYLKRHKCSEALQ